MNTLSANTLIEAAKLQENFDGLADGSFDDVSNSLELTRLLTIKSFIASGGVITGDSYGVNRDASMTSIIAIIGGKYATHTSVSGRAYTASKDTYVDMDYDGTLTYTEVANNAASPALASNSVRVGIVVTGASTIAASTSINQGQLQRTLPSTCNVGKAGIDSLGNKIYPRNPNGVITFIGNAALVGAGDILSLTLPLLADYDLQVKGDVSWRWTGTPAVQQNVALVIDGTTIQTNRVDVWTNNMTVSDTIAGAASVSAGSRVVKLNLSGGGGQDFTAASMIIVATPR